MIVRAPTPPSFFQTAERLVTALKHPERFYKTTAENKDVYELPLSPKLEFADQAEILANYINSLINMTTRTDSKTTPLAFCPSPVKTDKLKKMMAVQFPVEQKPNKGMLTVIAALIKHHRNQSLREWHEVLKPRGNYSSPSKKMVVSDLVTTSREAAEDAVAVWTYHVNLLERFHHLSASQPDELPRIITEKDASGNDVFKLTMSNDTLTRLKRLESLSHTLTP